MMSEYGMEVFDGSGNLTFESDTLKHRLKQIIVTSSVGNHYYNESFAYAPTVVNYASDGGVPLVWEHITSGGQYVGIKTLDDPFADGSTVFMIFAYR